MTFSHPFFYIYELNTAEQNMLNVMNSIQIHLRYLFLGYSVSFLFQFGEFFFY
jgi:hypothetical protein